MVQDRRCDTVIIAFVERPIQFSTSAVVFAGQKLVVQEVIDSLELHVIRRFVAEIQSLCGAAGEVRTVPLYFFSISYATRNQGTFEQRKLIEHAIGSVR